MRGTGKWLGGMAIAIPGEVPPNPWRTLMYGDRQMKMLTVMQPGMTMAPLPVHHIHIVSGSSRIRTIPHHLRRLYPHMAWLLSLMLATGLSGCGPTASDQAPNQESRASLAAPSESPSDSQRAQAALNDPPPQPDKLVLPVWIAQALDAPDVSIRLQALDKWAKLGAQAPLDPLIVALDDEDDDVRRKAMEIIEQHWAAEQETEPETETNRNTGSDAR